MQAEGMTVRTPRAKRLRRNLKARPMLDIILSIAPIFILIALGQALWRGGIPSVAFWNMNDKLVYWVLFPALLFAKTSTIPLSGALMADYALLIYGGFAAAFLFALIAARLCRFAPPLATSLLQGAARHNTFIAIAVAERLFGTEGLALAALITALLIPVTNVSVVAAMVALLRGRGGPNVVAAIAGDLLRNPLLIAVALGLSLNVADVGRLPVLHEIADILGSAALPIVLLCIGANIRINEMAAAALPVVLSVMGKMLVFPAAVLALAQLRDLPETALMIALLFGAVPTAASGYSLARQMGGDAPAMATIITLQTALAFLTLPLTLVVVRQIL